MRVLPLALWHRGSDAELVSDAQAQSRVTHGHPRVQLCCALYCLWARRMLADVADPWPDAVATLRRVLGANDLWRTELDDHIRPDDPPSGQGGGYVVECLHSARLALTAGDYEAVVKSAVALRHETQTTALLAGGLPGPPCGGEAVHHPHAPPLRRR